MAASIETSLFALSPCRLLAAQDLQMPLFQRKFSWGVGELAANAVDYADQFLTNNDATDYFGPVILYSAERFNFSTDVVGRIYVADGQHRMVTLALFATAITDRLTELLEHESDEDERAILEEYRADENLGTLRRTSLRVVIDDAGNSPCVREYLQERKEQYSRLKQRIAEMGANARADVDGLGPQAKKERQASRKAELDALTGQLRQLEHEGVFASYLGLLDSLPRVNDKRFSRKVEAFIKRLTILQSNVVYLLPRTGQLVSEDVLEGEAYATFATLHGHCNPLTAGDLFKSYVATKGATSPVNEYRYNDYGPRKFLGKLGISDLDHIVEFLAAYLPADKPVDSYRWLKLKLFGNSNSKEVLRTMHHALSMLDDFETDLARAESRIASLYELYFSTSSRAAKAVFIARMYEGVAAGATLRLEELLRVLVLFEVMVLHVTSSGKRANPGRDIPLLKGTSLSTGLAYVLRHFEVKTVEEFGAKLKTVIAEGPFGQAVYRKLGKLLLVMSDCRNPGADVSVPSWSRFDYEHLVPQKIAGALESPLLPDVARTKLEAIAELPHLLKQAELNRLGNAALLAGRENSGLGNKSPWEKLEKTRAARLDNAWWPTHKSFLEGTSGVIGLEEVAARSERLANEIVSFLMTFDADTLAETEQLLATREDGKPAKLLLPATSAAVAAEDSATVEVSASDAEKASRRAPNTRIIVHTRRGPLNAGKAVATFVAAIEAAGVADVASLGLELNGEPLISAAPSVKYPAQSKQSGQFFITTQSNNKAKVELLEEISERLNLGWTIEVTVAATT